MRSKRPATVESPPYSRGGFRVVNGLLENRQRIAFLLSILGRFGVGFCDLLIAATMYQLFLLLQGQPLAHHRWWTPSTGLSAAMLATVFVVLRSLMDLFSSRLVFRLTQNLQTGFILRLTEGYSLLQWGRFVASNRSELSGHVLYSTREAADFYHRSVEITASVAIVIIMIAALIYQSPLAAGILCLALGVFYGGHRFLIRKKLQEAASKRETSLRALQRNLADALSSGKEIRTYGNHNFFQDRIRRQAQNVATCTLRVWFLPQFARIVADQGAVLVFLSLIVAVQFREGDVHQLLALLVFCFVLSRRMLPLISQIAVVAAEMESSYESIKVVDSELDKSIRYRHAPSPVQMPDEGMVMEMRGVSFSFAGNRPILRDVDLSIREGETIVIRGASGIGKSSLLDLIAGIAQPAAGDVRIDRKKIAYVPQEIPLLDDSIRNNLLFGLPGRSDEEMMRALRTAMLDSFVAEQRLGLETRVGDNGALFSGGQRQRLGLARAVLRGSRLLLLDEATSALDEENERQVLANLTASGKALLIVTHRAHAQTFADRVFRLEGCTLVQEASPGPPPREAGLSMNAKSFHDESIVEFH